ncbi:MAG TPA: NAD(P)H-binding protein [Streptosporangiaceae bacterium]|nr:NAD(P)H-binding protein [Streptosporangiaceae bacterium]
MRLALLGASGRIGRHVLARALESGHDVTALARDPQSLAAAQRGLTVLAGDATDSAMVAELMTGADAVLSALGPRGAKSPALLASAGRNIVAGMTKAGVRRLVCVSAAGAFIQHDPDSGALVKMILPRVLAKQFADVREMEAAISASDLDWTLVRATRLVNTGLTTQYRVRPEYPPRGGWKISRADVAHFMAAALAEDSWVRGHPALAY